MHLSRKVLNTVPRFLYQSFSKYKSYASNVSIPMNLELFKSILEIKDANVARLLSSSSMYIPKEVYDASSATKVYAFSYRWDEVDMRVYFTECKGQQRATKLKQYIDVLNMFVYILNRYVKNRPLTVKVVMNLAPHQKMLKFPSYDPQNQATVLGPMQINSGVTYWGSAHDAPISIVFRKEEFNKVLMHELMHYYNIDSMIECADCAQITRGIEREFKLQGIPLMLGEGFTDTMAVLFMIGIDVLHKKQKKQSIDDYYKDYMQAFHKNQSYITDVASRVLSYYKYTDFGKPEPMVQGTHVFSYYISKAANFSHIESFARVLAKHGVSDPRIGTAYATHIMNVLMSSEFRRLMNSKLKRKSRKGFLNTLKMTEVEFL